MSTVEIPILQAPGPTLTRPQGNTDMEKATISQVENHFNAYLSKAISGDTVLILDRGQAVARLEGISLPTQTDERLARLERAGVVRRATGPLPVDLLRKPAAKARHSVLQALLEERQAGR